MRELLTQGRLSGMSTRCVIVDDSYQFRVAAGQLLDSGGLSVVGMASNSAEALATIEETRPDVALVDVRLGGESGLDLAERINKTPRKLVVILVSTCPAEDMEEASSCPFLTKTALSGSAIQGIVSRHS